MKTVRVIIEVGDEVTRGYHDDGLPMIEWVRESGAMGRVTLTTDSVTNGHLQEAFEQAKKYLDGQAK